MTHRAQSCTSLVLASDLRSAAIGEQFDPGDEAGVVRAQKQRDLGDLFGLRPIGTVETRAMASGGCSATCGVMTGPGLRTFARIRRSFSSAVQERTNERIAALLAA